MLLLLVRSGAVRNTIYYTSVGRTALHETQRDCTENDGRLLGPFRQDAAVELGHAAAPRRAVAQTCAAACQRTEKPNGQIRGLD